MISWEEAQALTPNEFGKKIIAEIEAASNKKCTYSTLSSMIYRSKSRIMTWLSPNSAEPLPLNERHHIWLAACLVIFESEGSASSFKWDKRDDVYLKKNYALKTNAELAEKLGRTAAAIQLRARTLGITRKVEKSRNFYSDDETAILKNTELSNAEVAKLIGRRESSVSMKRQRMGVAQTNRFSEEALQIINDRNLSDDAAAKILGRTELSVKAKRQTMGLKRKWKKEGKSSL